MSLATKKRAYLVARILFIIPGVAIGVMFYSWANSPSSQPIKVGNQTESEGPPVASSLKSVSTKYFTIQLPANFKIQTNVPSGPNQLIQMLSYEPYSGGVQVGVVSNILPNSGLSGVADYNLRKTKPTEYQPLALAGGNNSVEALFMLKDKSELSAYLVDGSRYASITVSGPPEKSEQLQQRLEETLQTWEWQ